MGLDHRSYFLQNSKAPGGNIEVKFSVYKRKVFHHSMIFCDDFRSLLYEKYERRALQHCENVLVLLLHILELGILKLLKHIEP